MNVRIPAAVAVAFWGAAAAAVLGYTFKAFKETANGQPPRPTSKAERRVQNLAGTAPQLLDMNTLAQQPRVPGPATKPRTR